MVLPPIRKYGKSPSACLRLSAIRGGIVILCLSVVQLLLISKPSLQSIAHLRLDAISGVAFSHDSSFARTGFVASPGIVSNPLPAPRRRLGERSTFPISGTNAKTPFRLALLRPFAPHDASDLVESFAEWEKLTPCDTDTKNFPSGSTGSSAKYQADLFLSISQTFSVHPEVKEIISRLVNDTGRLSLLEYSSWDVCFGSIRLIEAGVSPDIDRYGVSSPDQTDNLWVNGPNEHFIRSIRQIQAMDTPYDAALFMEPDVHPWKEQWLDQIMEEVTQKRPFSMFGSENHGMIWRQSRDAMPIPLRHHLTGNSVFNLTDPFFNRFVEELEVERDTFYHAIPYDYRLSQMFYEASQGVTPDFPFHQMKDDNGNEVALPNKTAIFRGLWLDVVRAGREDSIIKKSSSIDNFGGTNFLPQQVSSHAAVVHGKLRRDNWNGTAHPMSLVVLGASSDSFHHILGDLDSADHPFTEVVVIVRDASSLSNDKIIRRKGSPSISVSVHYLPHVHSIVADLCEIIGSVSNEWFVVASSADRVASPHLYFPVSRSYRDAVVPVVPFVTNDNDNTEDRKLVLDNQLVFHRGLYLSFCKSRDVHVASDGGKKKDRSLAASFIDYLDSIGVTDSIYTFSDKVLHGAFQNFITNDVGNRDSRVAIQRTLQVLAEDRAESRVYIYPTTTSKSARRSKTKSTRGPKATKGPSETKSTRRPKAAKGPSNRRNLMRGDRVEGVPHTSDSRVAIQRALQILAEDRAKNQRLKSRRRNLMLGIRLEDVQYKSEQRLGEGTTAIRARTLPAGNHGTNDASPSRYVARFHIYQIAKSGGEEFSLLLTCILQGLLEPDELHALILNEELASDVKLFGPRPDGVQDVAYPLLFYNGDLAHSRDNIGNTLVSQVSPEADVSSLTRAFGDLFGRNVFVAVHSTSSETNDLAIEERFCVRTNIVCIDHEDFTYNNDSELAEGIKKVASILSSKIPLFARVPMDIDAATERVKLMEEVALKMNEQPRTARDPMFGLVGGQPLEDDEADNEKFVNVNAGPFHFFQVAKPHTGSTLLNAILQGLFEQENSTYAYLPTQQSLENYDLRFGPYPLGVEEEDIAGVPLPFIVHDGRLKLSRAHLSDTLVTKTHVVDIDLLEDTFGRQVEQTFYVVANRAEKDIAIDERYCGYSNVFCVDYDDFAYSPDSSSSEEIMGVINRIKMGILDKFALPDDVLMDTQRALDRVKRMEQATEMMAGKTFDEVENTFGIHGGHRNRYDKPVRQIAGNNDEGGAADRAPATIVHVISPHRIAKCDKDFCPYDQAQSVAIASMQHAAKHATMASVTLAATAFTEEADNVIPKDFLHLDPLLRSTRSEFPEFKSDKKLPIIADIFENLKMYRDFYTFDYVIYTNSDIIVHESFYDIVALVIQHGHDAFTINRQTVSKTGKDGVHFSAVDLVKIFALEGDEHPGSDCFVIKREIFEQIKLGDLYLGFPPFSNFILFQLEGLAENYRVFRSNELKATYHLGDDRSWNDEDESSLELYTHQYHYAIEDLLPLWSSFCLFDWRSENGHVSACTSLVRKFRKFAKTYIGGGIETLEQMYNKRLSTRDESANGGDLKAKEVEEIAGTDNLSSKLPLHVMQAGPPRTGTTLQFQIVCLSMFKALLSSNNASLLDKMECRLGGGDRFVEDTPMVLKTKLLEQALFEGELPSNIPQDTWLFTTSRSNSSSPKLRNAYNDWRSKGYDIRYIQDVSLLSEREHLIALEYQSIFGLSNKNMQDIIEYLQYWDVLRRCCGMQMSRHWRAHLMPRDKVMTQQKVNGVVDSSKVSFCQGHNISSIENAFMATKLYQELKVRPKLHPMLSPSNVDDVLDGSYCSRYNDFVRNTGAQFNEPLCRDGMVASNNRIKEHCFQQLESSNQRAEPSTAAIAPKLSSNSERIAFQFVIGVEGTGHQLHRTMYQSSPVGKWLVSNKVGEDIVNLTLALWDEENKSGGIWSAPCSNADANEGDGDWWEIEEAGPEGDSLFDTLVERLQGVEKKIEEALANDRSSSFPVEQPIVVAINAGVAGRGVAEVKRKIAPHMSYPMFRGPCRAFQYPNIDILYRACDVAGVRCQHSVAFRDPYRVLKSTSMNRHFASRHVQLTTLASMQHIILSQMMAHPDRLVACWESDADTETPKELGQLFGWTDPADFEDAYNNLFIAPPLITATERKDIIKDDNLKVYMDGMVASNNRIKELCFQQLESSNQRAEPFAKQE